MDAHADDQAARIISLLKRFPPRGEPADSDPGGAGGPAEIFVCAWSRGVKVRPTSHRRTQLNLCLRGTVDMAISDHLPHLGTGEAVLIPSFEYHFYGKFEPAPGADGLWWLALYFTNVSPTLLARLAGRVIPLSPEAWRRLEGLLAGVEAHAMGRSGTWDESEPWLMLLLAELARTPSPRSPPPRGRNVSPAPPAAMQAAVRYIGAHLSEPLSLTQVAEASHVSESHLRRLAYRTLGMGLGEFIRRNRLTRAAALLQSTSMRIGEIAEACGFTSIYAFSRAFHSAYDQSPSRFRRASSTKSVPPAV